MGCPCLVSPGTRLPSRIGRSRIGRPKRSFPGIAWLRRHTHRSSGFAGWDSCPCPCSSRPGRPFRWCNWPSDIAYRRWGTRRLERACHCKSLRTLFRRSYRPVASHAGHLLPGRRYLPSPPRRRPGTARCKRRCSSAHRCRIRSRTGSLPCRCFRSSSWECRRRSNSNFPRSTGHRRRSWCRTRSVRKCMGCTAESECLGRSPFPRSSPPAWRFRWYSSAPGIACLRKGRCRPRWSFRCKLQRSSCHRWYMGSVRRAVAR